MIKPVLGSLPRGGGVCGIPMPVYLPPFNEGTGSRVNDLSGNENTGTLLGGTLWYPGKFGSCLHFDGSDDYVNIPHSPSIDIGTGDITVIAWFKYTTRVTGSRIFNKGGAKRYEIIYSSPVANDIFTFTIDDNVTKTEVAFTTDNLNDGNWHRVVAQRNYGVQIRIKVDDGAWATHSDDTGDISNTVDAQIGTNEHYATGHWNGEIDGVKVFNELLSDTQLDYLDINLFPWFKRDPIELWSAAMAGAPPVGAPGAMTLNTGYWGPTV